MRAAGAFPALEDPLGRLCEPEAHVEPVRVGGVQEPADVAVRAVLDQLLHELDPEPAPPYVRVDVDVGQVRKYDAVRDDAAEPELPLTRVQADDAGGLTDEPLDDLPRSPFRPVRLLREEPVHLADVDPIGIVVELVAA